MEIYFKGKPNGLNVIRAFLAAIVCVSHVGWIYGEDNLQIRSLGVYSVAVFFGISGFLIYQSAANSSGIQSFALKRIRRIFPAFIMVLIATALVYYPLYQFISNGRLVKFLSLEQFLYIGSNISLHIFKPEFGVPLELSGTKDWNPSLWTLEFEFLLYFICYLVSRLLKTYSKVLIPLFTILLVITTKIQLFPDFFREAAYLGQFFFFGMTLWLFKAYIKLTIKSALVFVFGVVLSYLVLEEFVVTSGFLILLALLAGITLKLSKFQDTDYSYGIYLHSGPVTHLAVLAIKKAEFPLLVGYVLSLIFSILAGVISWHLIESRFKNRKYKYRQPLS